MEQFIFRAILQLAIIGVAFLLGHKYAIKTVAKSYYNVLKHFRITERLAGRDKQSIEGLSKYEEVPPVMSYIGDFSNAFFTERNSRIAINELEDHFVGSVIDEDLHSRMLEAIDEGFAEYEAETNQSDNQSKTGDNYGNDQRKAETNNASTS